MRNSNEAVRVFGRPQKEWNCSTAAPPLSTDAKLGDAPRTMPPEVAHALRKARAVAPMSIAQEDFKNDVNLWMRGARQLVNQLYRAKFVLGDLALEGVDELFAQDKAGELHADDVPVDQIFAAAAAPQEKEAAEAKLKRAEAIIRKLYAKSMALSEENAALRHENQRLHSLASREAQRPRTATGDRQELSARPQSGHQSDRVPMTGARVNANDGMESGPGVQKGDVEEGQDVLDAGGRQGRSTSVPPAYLQPGCRALERAGGTRAPDGGGTASQLNEVKELESALKASETRVAALRQELDHHKRLELLLWEGEHMEPVRADVVVGKLRARLESAKELLKSVTSALQEAKNTVQQQQVQLKQADVLTRKRLRGYLAHSNQIVAALFTIIQRVPLSGGRGGGPRQRSKEDPVVLSQAQGALLESIRNSVESIGDLSSSMVGDRNEQAPSRSDGRDSDDSEEDEAPDPFSTSSLLRSTELIALQLSPDAREELLALMRDVYQRFYLVKMEQDALLETHEELRADSEASVAELVMERAVLRGAVTDLLQHLERAGDARLGRMEHRRQLERDALRGKTAGMCAEGGAGEEGSLESIQRLVDGTGGGESETVLMKAHLELQALEEAQEAEATDDDEEAQDAEATDGEPEHQGEDMYSDDEGPAKEVFGAEGGLGEDGDGTDTGSAAAGDESMEAASANAAMEKADGDDEPFEPLRRSGEEVTGATSGIKPEGTGQMRKLFVVQIDDGCLYEGEGFVGGWEKGGLPDGFGAETYPDGTSYEGQFEQGLRSGLGVYYFTNGRMYEGQWQKGVREGVGVERFESAGASEAEVEAAVKGAVIVTYREGGLVGRKPLAGAQAEVSTLMMDVVDAVEVARAAARDARAAAD